MPTYQQANQPSSTLGTDGNHAQPSTAGPSNFGLDHLAAACHQAEEIVRAAQLEADTVIGGATAEIDAIVENLYAAAAEVAS